VPRSAQPKHTTKHTDFTGHSQTSFQSPFLASVEKVNAKVIPIVATCIAASISFIIINRRTRQLSSASKALGAVAPWRRSVPHALGRDALTGPVPFAKLPFRSAPSPPTRPTTLSMPPLPSRLHPMHQMFHEQGRESARPWPPTRTNQKGSPSLTLTLYNTRHYTKLYQLYKPSQRLVHDGHPFGRASALQRVLASHGHLATVISPSTRPRPLFKIPGRLHNPNVSSVLTQSVNGSRLSTCGRGSRLRRKSSALCAGYRLNFLPGTNARMPVMICICGPRPG